MRPEDKVTVTAEAQDFVLVLGAAKGYVRMRKNAKLDTLKESIHRVEEELNRTDSVDAALEQ